jgi:formylglycine-generating enzyme required for sulfatase activity
VATIIKLKDIDDAVSNLNYKNKETLKYKLIYAIRQYYVDDSSVDFLKSIDTEELVKTLWHTGECPGLIKSKKKNLSSIKSGVNADLKNLYQEGKNPQGVVIGQSNVFDMSDEAKDKALEAVAGVLKDKGTDTINKIIEVLNTVNDILSKSSSFSDSEGGLDQRDRMQDLIFDLSRKVGFSLPGDTEMGQGAGAGTGYGAIDDAIGMDEQKGLTGAIGRKVAVSEEVTEAIVDEAEADILAEVADDGVVEEIDQALEEEVIDEIVDEVDADVSGEVTEAIADETEAAISEEAADGTAEDGVETEIDQVLEEEVIDEIVDEVDNAVSEEVSETFPAGGLEEIEADVDSDEAESDDVLEEQEEVVWEAVEEDLRKKAETLAKLVEAAKILERVGPDFDESVYSEKEIKEKAKLLSEEFERDLSIREKYFNQHILIKGTEYSIGGSNLAKNELPEQKIRLLDFYIGKFPVTNALFEIFVEKTGYRTTAERHGYGFVYTPRAQRVKDGITGMETFVWSSHLQYKKVKGACWYHPNGPDSSLYDKRRHPVVQVSMEDARAFASWTGKRIPMEKEWEAAARTSRGHIYPWGNQWKDNSCNIEKSYCGDTTPVDKYLESANDFGVADTLGNVLEWTLDHWGSNQSKDKNTEIYVVKGGSWISDGSLCLPGRYPMDKKIASNILGFRCVAI